LAFLSQFALSRIRPGSAQAAGGKAARRVPASLALVWSAISVSKIGRLSAEA
jgi:hypothetical protein